MTEQNNDQTQTANQANSQAEETVPAWAQELMRRQDSLTSDFSSYKARTNKELKQRRMQLEQVIGVGGEDKEMVDQSSQKQQGAKSPESPWVRKMVSDKLSSYGLSGDTLDILSGVVAGMDPEQADVIFGGLQGLTGRRAGKEQETAEPVQPKSANQGAGRAGAGSSGKPYRTPQDFKDLTRNFSPAERAAFIKHATPEEMEEIYSKG